MTDTTNLKETIRNVTLQAGFVRVRLLAPFDPPVSTCRQGAPSLLTAALPYGNQHPRQEPPGEGPFGYIAPFAQRNYYREAVKRLRGLAREFRSRYGGKKSDFRILCNSPVPEKPLAVSCGLGVPGRNGLVITREAGSLIVIAAMTLPYELPGDAALGPAAAFPDCGGCDRDNPPCKQACPTGAVRGDGSLDLYRCVQWYASGKGDHVPEEIARNWGMRLYGCTACQDACPWNRHPIPGAVTGEGPLPAYGDCRELLACTDGELAARFKGTALGLSWLGPRAIRRNARMVCNYRDNQPGYPRSGSSPP
jgi:epoxyqueuosine reductase